MGTLFEEVLEQIDSVILGQNAIDIKLVYEYNVRLTGFGSNIDTENISKIMHDYLSDDFMIDCDGAIELFKDVRVPGVDLTKLITSLIY